MYTGNHFTTRRGLMNASFHRAFFGFGFSSFFHLRGSTPNGLMLFGREQGDFRFDFGHLELHETNHH